MAYGGHKGYIFRRKWITRSLKNIIKDQDFFKKGSEYVANVFEMIEELKKKDYLHFTRTSGLDMVYPYKELTDYYKTYAVYED